MIIIGFFIILSSALTFSEFFMIKEVEWDLYIWINFFVYASMTVIYSVIFKLLLDQVKITESFGISLQQEKRRLII